MDRPRRGRGQADDVDGLFVGDHSAIPNSIGGQNPTHTGQALAIRTADAIHERYFDGDGDVPG